MQAFDGSVKSVWGRQAWGVWSGGVEWGAGKVGLVEGLQSGCAKSEKHILRVRAFERWWRDFFICPLSTRPRAVPTPTAHHGLLRLKVWKKISKNLEKPRNPYGD